MTCRDNRILIIGKTPPPLGGVTIHTSRLLDLCKQEKIKFEFYDLNRFDIFSFVKTIGKSHIAHIHASNPILLFVFALICNLLNTYSILTIHCNICSHKKIMSCFQLYAIHLVKRPILLNRTSFNKALNYNKNSVIISAFIPPLHDGQVSNKHLKQINNVKNNTDYIFCTNAFDFVRDKYGNEVYGILSLIELFNNYQNFGLIISDPKGSYSFYIDEHKIKTNHNITLLTGSHSFYEIIKQSSCLIRYTSTDGDSLSINEALFLNKPVLATDCVDRPEGVILVKYGNDRSLLDGINQIVNKTFKYLVEKHNAINGGKELINMYRGIS